MMIFMGLKAFQAAMKKSNNAIRTLVYGSTGEGETWGEKERETWEREKEKQRQRKRKYAERLPFSGLSLSDIC